MSEDNGSPNTGDDLEVHEDFRETKPEEMGQRSKPIPDGKYHCQILTVTKETGKDGKKGAMVLKLKVLHGDYKNRIIYERVFLSDEAAGRRHLIEYRLGLIAKDVAGKEKDVSWRPAIDKQVVAVVTVNQYKDAQGKDAINNKVDYDGIFLVTDPMVADVPKNLEAMEAASIETGGGGKMFDAVV